MASYVSIPRSPFLGPTPTISSSKPRAWAFINAFLTNLDEGKRMVYVLSRFEGLSALEIAKAVAIPLNTVYSRIHAVENAFKRFLSAHGQGEFP